MKEFIKKIWEWIVSIPKDKLLHDYAAALICLYAFAVMFRFCPVWLCFTLADVLAVVFLALKEIYDFKHPETQTAEIADFIWGLFGIFKVTLALLIMFV